MSSDRTANKVAGIPAPPPFLSSAIISNGLVFCSGALPTRPDGTLVKGTMKDRLNACLDNLEAVLKVHGSGLEHIVKTNIFVTSYEHFAEMNEAYTARMPIPAPARSCVGVALLPMGVDIEIEAIGQVAKARL